MDGFRCVQLSTVGLKVLQGVRRTCELRGLASRLQGRDIDTSKGTEEQLGRLPWLFICPVFF
jgi:hypothetical protein